MKTPDDVAAPFEALPLAGRDFELIRQMARGAFGLDLKPGKEELVSARLGRLVRKGGFRNYQDYCRHIQEDRTGLGLAAMIDALATNHTSFFREPDHFQFLREQVLPALANRGAIELWCAACSTGEEVWTLAMLLSEACMQGRFSITASDISNKALAAAATADYSRERCQGIPPDWLGRYFAPTRTGTYTAAPRLRSRATFQRINLVEPLPWARQYPIIFCRNVMIYFDRDTQEQVVGRLAGALEPGGYLFVGHAESLTRITHSLEFVRPAIYRKTGGEGRWNRS